MIPATKTKQAVKNTQCSGDHAVALSLHEVNKCMVDAAQSVVRIKLEAGCDSVVRRDSVQCVARRRGLSQVPFFQFSRIMLTRNTTF